LIASNRSIVMRTFLLLAFVALSASSLVAGAPQAPLCPSLPVQLELRTSPVQSNKYQLVFASIDQTQNYQNAPDFVDIHYRINNENSVNLRVMTQDSVTQHNVPAKQALVDNITLLPGDALRAYATYSAKGYACDTPIHTFSAPDFDEKDTIIDTSDVRRFGTINRRFPNTPNTMQTMAVRGIRSIGGQPSGAMRRPMSGIYGYPIVDQFYTQADIDQTSPFEQNACPSVPLNEDIVKIQGLDNTYMLSFENRNPSKQLHYVDLHLSTDAANGWDNLRLASDMQLNLAHRVMQPGIVVKPHQTLKWYWSYRTVDTNGQVVDCTTPIQQITPQEVTHEITMAELNKAANN
jgi:hypothetical protein